jgi:hypothetical protein
MNNTTVDVSSDEDRSLGILDSTLQINHKMSASNDELLYYAARDGQLEKVKELLSKGVGTSYRNVVS